MSFLALPEVFVQAGSAPLSSFIDVPISEPTIATNPISMINIRINATIVGIPFSRSQIIKGVTSIARNKAINNGTTIALADFKPAMIITRQARINKTRRPL